MVRRRSELPSIGELVVGTVKKVFNYGAYLTLDEYMNREAYLPWSEVSSKWVRDIKDFVQEGQKVVVKVIRIDRRKGHIDVSMKRVNASEQRRKVLEFKRAQRAEKLMEVVAKRLKKTLDEAYREVGWPLEDYYGEIYAGFEEAAYRGSEALTEAGVREPWIDALMEEIRKHIKIKTVKIKGLLTLWTTLPDGANRLKNVLTHPLKNLNLPNDTKVKVYSVGAPRYRVEVISTDYKRAEKVLSEYVSQVQRLSKRNGVNFAYVREKA